MKTDMICISCPMGCRMTVEHEGKDLIAVAGNSCKRGEIYAKNEISDPRRVVTSIMRVRGRKCPVSVRTNGAVPKSAIRDCLLAIQDKTAPADTAPGDVLIPNVAATGIDVVAMRYAYDE